MLKICAVCGKEFRTPYRRKNRCSGSCRDTQLAKRVIRRRRLNISKIKELFDYKDGNLIWRERPKEHFRGERAWASWHSRFCGKPVGSFNREGYMTTTIIGVGTKKDFKIHRLIWVWHYGRWPKGEIDHIDHNRGNNKIENLREVSRKENAKNLSISKLNSSGVSGVTWDRTLCKWVAKIRVEGKTHHIGVFDSIEEAENAREAAKEKYGYHKNHGRNVV